MATKVGIKKSLVKQLQSKGANVDHFSSLVDDYIWYWEQEKSMQKDVEIRGKCYETYSATGTMIEKENPSVKNALAYNKQKLAILKELELTTKNVTSDKDDEL